MTQELISRLRGTTLPAVLTPMRADGTVDYDALDAYAAAVAAKPIGGLAVWAHTGRGLYLSESDRAAVLRAWRASTTRPVIAGVGVPRDVRLTAVSAEAAIEESVEATLRMAVAAAALGADAVMAYPLAAFATLADGHERAVALHERIAAESGLPVLGFYLHGEAGGYAYPPDLIRDLLTLPTALGVKLATLDRAMACQDAIRAAEPTGRLVVTGEDRMFGPSLMWGADTALVGIAAAQVELTTAVLDAWTARDETAFVRASARLDRFAEATFYAPIEGYVQRMLWAAVWEGLIPEPAACDPYGPAMAPGERERVVDVLEALAKER
ncbi:dihydrodipicolinate synthase family protein [Streptomyces boninensis]|uniref:dihydrodipicolinate synthase family protein n=1 Tax=Streptomyces boninensis TaxID=2039455 RepID=UPI003B211F7E